MNEKIPSDHSLAARIVDRMLIALETEKWSAADRFGIHLSLEEALANAIKHGTAVIRKNMSK